MSCRSLLTHEHSSTLRALEFYIANIAHLKDFYKHSKEIIREEPSSASKKDEIAVSANSNAALMPSEQAALCCLKCSLLIRTFDFIKVVVADCQYLITLLQKKSVLSVKTYKLLIQCLLAPSTLGFEVRDTEILKNLLPRLTDILMSLHQTLPNDEKKSLVSVIDDELSRDDRDLSVLLPCSNIGNVRHVPPSSQHYLRGLEALHLTGWLQHSTKVTSSSLAKELQRWAADMLLGSCKSSQSPATTQQTPSPALKQFAGSVLKIAIKINQNVRTVKVIKLFTLSGNFDL